MQITCEAVARQPPRDRGPMAAAGAGDQCALAGQAFMAGLRGPPALLERLPLEAAACSARPSRARRRPAAGVADRERVEDLARRRRHRASTSMRSVAAAVVEAQQVQPHAARAGEVAGRRRRCRRPGRSARRAAPSPARRIRSRTAPAGRSRVRSGCAGSRWLVARQTMCVAVPRVEPPEQAHRAGCAGSARRCRRGRGACVAIGLMPATDRRCSASVGR